MVVFTSSAVVSTNWWHGPGEIVPRYDEECLPLIAKHRPAVIPAQLPPDDGMRQYRSTHRMMGPCCLCPLIYPSGPDFVESAMYFATTGLHAGLYVASCANDRCGYLGKLDPIMRGPLC